MESINKIGDFTRILSRFRISKVSLRRLKTELSKLFSGASLTGSGFSTLRR